MITLEEARRIAEVYETEGCISTAAQVARVLMHENRNLLEAATRNTAETRTAIPVAMADVINERGNQIERGFVPMSDDAYKNEELVQAAVCYASQDTRFGNKYHGASIAPTLWPFHSAYWKPTTHRRNLVKAAALLVAEIERIDRADGRVVKNGQ